MLDNYMTRRQVRKATGWSLTFIAKNVPFVKFGGKVLVDRNALSALLKGASAAPNFAPHGVQRVEYADEPRDVPVAPILSRSPGRAGGWASVSVRCPFCGGEHTHGAGEGPRIAHCAQPVPGAPSEYFVPA